MNTARRAAIRGHTHWPRILVVEDEFLVAQDLQSRLAFLGYTVAGLALDGPEAVKLATTTKPELVLMDINLGDGMNGIETANAIRRHLDVPIIYITANSDDLTIQRAAESDPFGFILKPFDERSLDSAIQLGVSKHLMERCLRESEHRFNTTLTSIADGVIATCEEGRIEFMNPSAEEITGWKLTDALGRKLADVFCLEDDQGSATDTALFASFPLAVVPGASRTATLRRHDRTQIPVEYRAAQMHRDRHSSRGAVISFSDITARRAAEQEIRSTQERLQAAHQSLEHKHEELQNLYHMVSHELKTPLTSAREFVSLVLEGLAGPVTATQQEYLSIAQESCDQMRTCINDMLDVTRLETGKISMEFRASSLPELVRRTVTILSPAAEQKRIRLTCAIQSGVDQVCMDETRIAQVLRNLLGNALKFTNEGGAVKVTVEPADESQHVQIIVADTGRGIPAELLGRIFDRLFQVRGEDASSRMGLGLGLFICRELVQLHHGRIRVESEVGQGSRFYVTLPVGQPAA